MSTLTRDLVVIEASGKLRQLHRVIEAIGLRATCIATLGHVLESPSRLRPLEIHRDAQGEYHETRRVSPRPEVHARLTEALRALRGRLFIATDDDQEGHAIAEDVAALAKQLRPELTPLRVLAGALTEQAFRSALALAQPLTAHAAMPAIARRMADRTIAATFSRPEEGVVVGRVAAAIAGLARDGGIPAGLVTLQVPAKDGRGGFTAQTPVRSAADAAALLEAAAAAAPIAASGPAQPCALAPPATHADYLMAMGEGGRLSLAQAAQLLQGLYEGGVVSYPRTAGQRYRTETRARLAQMASRHGVRAMPLPATDDGKDAPHEPLHVVDAKALDALNLSRPQSLQRDHRSAALAWISRRMFESLTVVQRETGDTRALPGPLAVLAWSRDAGPTPAWYTRPRAGMHAFTPEQAVLQGMVAAGIGRPSTYVGHVVRAIERGVVAPDRTLGPEGRRMLEAAPPALSQAATARAIERGCDEAASRGIGPTVDHLLALAVGQQDALLGRVATLLQSSEWEEPVHAPAF